MSAIKREVEKLDNAAVDLGLEAGDLNWTLNNADQDMANVRESLIYGAVSKGLTIEDEVDIPTASELSGLDETTLKWLIDKDVIRPGGVDGNVTIPYETLLDAMRDRHHAKQKY